MKLEWLLRVTRHTHKMAATVLEGSFVAPNDVYPVPNHISETSKLTSFKDHYSSPLPLHVLHVYMYIISTII